MRRAWLGSIAIALGCGHAPPRPRLPACDASAIEAPVLVLGAVVRPGSYVLPSPTLALAVAAAGGATALGFRRHVIVRRTSTAGSRVAVYDLDRDPDLVLCASDSVEIPIRD